LVDSLSEANREVMAIHRQAKARCPSDSQEAFSIPRAAINLHDRHLGDWPKKEALLPVPQASPGEIPFGEFYLAWNEKGIHLALIAMDYHDLELLAYTGDYPVEEAFRVDWGVDAGSGARRFALYVVPLGQDLQGDAYQMHLRLCRVEGERRCEPVPGGVATYFGSDQPRIVVEILLPWQALGLDGPPSDGELRTELVATAFHRSRWMSLSGLPPERAMSDLSSWRKAALADVSP
jgi:hypothetical protein